MRSFFSGTFHTTTLLRESQCARTASDRSSALALWGNSSAPPTFGYAWRGRHQEIALRFPKTFVRFQSAYLVLVRPVCLGLS